MPESFAVPEVSEAIKLFDVVCSVDSVLASSLRFGAALKAAREHNEQNPGHDAEPIQQL